jgi:CheY-like chemotaxis protein
MAIVLVVEDDALICEVAIMMIEDLGHTTLSAGDVDEALGILRSAEPIDALFTDIYLKTAVMGGCDVAQFAVKVRPLLRVLYTTGNTVSEMMKTLLVVGTHVLPKPYTEFELRTSITKLLAS